MTTSWAQSDHYLRSGIHGYESPSVKAQIQLEFDQRTNNAALRLNGVQTAPLPSVVPFSVPSAEGKSSDDSSSTGGGVLARSYTNTLNTGQGQVFLAELPLGDLLKLSPSPVSTRSKSKKKAAADASDKSKAAKGGKGKGEKDI